MPSIEPTSRGLRSAVLIVIIVFIVFAASFLCGACGKDPTDPAPDGALSTDRLYIPVPEVRRSIDLQAGGEDARAARREISAVLNFSRLLLARVDSPARRLSRLVWEWEADGCNWVRWIEAEECGRLVAACERNGRIRWREGRDGVCGDPPRVYRDHVLLHGWSAPYGAAGRLAACANGDTGAIRQEVRWEMLAGSTVHWNLTKSDSLGRRLRMMLDRRQDSDRTETYEFVLPDSFRWTGRIGSAGFPGEVTAYRWRPREGGWVARDHFAWRAGSGRWTHYLPADSADIREWGGTVPGASGDATIPLAVSNRPPPSHH